MSFEIAKKLIALGKAAEVRASVEKILLNDPLNYQATELLIFINIVENEYQKALNLINLYIDNGGKKNNFILMIKANVLTELNQFNQAKKYFDELEILDPRNSSLHVNYANLYLKESKYKNALKYARKGYHLDSNNANAYLNAGIACMNLRKFKSAEILLNKSLNINNNYPALLNMGILMEMINDNTKAYYYFKKAMEANPNGIEILIKIASIEEENLNYISSIKLYEKAFNVNKKFDGLEGLIFRVKNRICDWTSYHIEKSNIINAIELGNPSIDPFTILTMTDDNLIIKKSVENSIKKINAPNYLYKNKIELNKNNKKIKVGYISSDFYDHATMRLMLETLESHNVKKFEIYLISLNAPTNDLIYQRLKNNFQEKFIDVSKYGVQQIIETLRNIGLDIAIDLKGYTKDSKPEIFAARVAPIQINYLGYPGSSYLKNMDYIISDEYITHAGFYELYSEKIINLQTSYQPNNSKTEIFNYDKKDFNLPNDKFVYCSFNGTQKLTPEIAECWIRIMKRTEDSVLWLYVDNLTAQQNLSMFFTNNGISTSRIFFANKVDQISHLNRISVADLQLDTFPYTAHTTCSDSLRSGVPILTILGKSFASRVCGSILKRFNVNELVVESFDQYINTAVEIYENRTLLKSIKNKILNKHNISNFFNPQLHAKSLEEAFDLSIKEWE